MIAQDETLQKLKFEVDKFRSLLGREGRGEYEKEIIEDISKVLNTPPFQALKLRKQLGLAHFVLDEGQANHSRFDHTIGVVAKCLVACDVINRNTNRKEIELSEDDIRELVVAAALHDCGHFPVSHATERAFLTAKGLTKGISHEERIIPFIVNRNPYFEDFRNIVLSWDRFDENSFYRIACIIHPAIGEEYEKGNVNFKLPKKAIQQLLVSDIDMDRLDYIIRDAESVSYFPVTLISDKLVKYVNGLSLEKYKTLNQLDSDENVELCLDEKLKENVFYLLVSRVLLYKYVYFSQKVRCFEAVLTYLVGTMIQHRIALEPLKLMAMSDEEFIGSHLDELVSNIDNPQLQKHLKEKYVNVLQKDKVERFRLFESIDETEIVNPRLKEEFAKNVNKRSYIDNLRTYLYTRSHDETVKLEQGDILIDIFHIKTGGGELLVKNEKSEFKTLNFYMNGSNMHKLCSELRLDVYMKSDLGDKKKKFIKSEIDSFFKNI